VNFFVTVYNIYGSYVNISISSIWHKYSQHTKPGYQTSANANFLYNSTKRAEILAPILGYIGEHGDKIEIIYEVISDLFNLQKVLAKKVADKKNILS